MSASVRLTANLTQISTAGDDTMFYRFIYHNVLNNNHRQGLAFSSIEAQKTSRWRVQGPFVSTFRLYRSSPCKFHFFPCLCIYTQTPRDPGVVCNICLHCSTHTFQLRMYCVWQCAATPAATAMYKQPGRSATATSGATRQHASGDPALTAPATRARCGPGPCSRRGGRCGRTPGSFARRGARPFRRRPGWR